jgi:hypothetical protein
MFFIILSVPPIFKKADQVPQGRRREEDSKPVMR